MTTVLQSISVCLKSKCEVELLSDLSVSIEGIVMRAKGCWLPAAAITRLCWVPKTCCSCELC